MPINIDMPKTYGQGYAKMQALIGFRRKQFTQFLRNTLGIKEEKGFIVPSPL
jgi:hypothetical protein